MSQCDVCGQHLPCVTGPHWVAGNETYACHRCRQERDEDCDEYQEDANGPRHEN